MTDQPTTVTMDAAMPTGTVFAVDTEKRTIRGLAVPFGVEGLKDGRRFMFSKGTLRFGDPSRVKLWVGHDKAQAVGVATELTETDEGLEAAFRVARGADGDRALTMAEDGVWDGLSVGASEGAKFALKDGVYHSVEVPFHEISMTPAPVFGGARVRSVAFDADKEGSGMTADTTVEAEAAAPSFDVTPIADAITQGFAALNTNPADPQGNRETVSAAEGFEVNEPSPYRFDGLRAEHSFVADLRAAFSMGDGEAKQRLEEFTEELARFAVTTGNVGSLNPTQNRPDLYVPNLTYSRPLFELVSTGNVDNVTPFTVPKFSSATGLVGAHTQGTEPTPGAFSATVQTITPAPKSGKIEINREVWDQGGSPQADQIIWGEMQNGWYEAIEAAIAAQLQATPTAELQLTSAVDSALVDALTGYLAGLQFVRGGNRFTQFAADGNLFPALVAAKDTGGRKLLPVVGPQNAQGTTDGAFDRVQLGNATIRAAWALGAAGSVNNQRSFNFVKSSVWCWTSTPKKFTFEYQVKSIDMAIWGYVATATLRDSDVKPIDYQVADV